MGRTSEKSEECNSQGGVQSSGRPATEPPKLVGMKRRHIPFSRVSGRHHDTHTKNRKSAKQRAKQTASASSKKKNGPRQKRRDQHSQAVKKPLSLMGFITSLKS